MNIKKILFGAVILIVLYVFYTTVFADKSKTNLVELHNALNNTMSINATKLSGSASADYTYSLWVYVNDYNKQYGEEKIILQRRTALGDTNIFYPKISLGENQNDLKIALAEAVATGESPTDVTHHNITVHNIPLQKWCQVIMTKSGKTIDVYLDGKLIKTSIMSKPAFPIDATVDVEITPKPGFSGYISKVNYFSNAINSREAYQLYKEGYGSGFLGNFFNRFKLKFAFMQDNQEKSSIIL
jgi:hypothetical protein